MERSELIERLNAMLTQTVENGCTPAEAENAARMLNALLVKYNLSLAEIQDVKVDDEMILDIPHDASATGQKIFYSPGQMPEYLHHLSVAIGRLNFCEVVGNPAAIFLGTRSDVEIAIYMVETLMRQIRQQAIAARRAWVKEKWGTDRQPAHTMHGKNYPKVWYESWVEGACSALASKFYSEVRKRDTQSDDKPTMALVVDKRAAARAFAQTKFPVWYGLAEPKQPVKATDDDENPKRRTLNSEAWRRGYSAGEKITPTRGVKSGSRLERIGGK